MRRAVELVRVTNERQVSAVYGGAALDLVGRTFGVTSAEAYAYELHTLRLCWASEYERNVSQVDCERAAYLGAQIANALSAR